MILAGSWFWPTFAVLWLAWFTLIMLLILHKSGGRR